MLILLQLSSLKQNKCQQLLKIMSKLFVAHQRFYNVSETLNYVQIVCRTPTFLQRFWNV